ncbi:MAG: winged helix-turn-helix transcriptional regulator [Deltaproteobacteria bacterium]|nr:winged helix-turn-helix transcriptional regulator [Deltaproteobacteria bacterium]NCP02618.1 winged helix-turn-helix transcriptional regulator [Deltaproteobacteria bacterium]
MNKQAKIFKALADETRLRILALLLDGELCVCEIMAALDLPQSTVSRHLAYLRNTGWVKDSRRGVWMYYKFNREESALIQALKPVLEIHLIQSREHAAALERLEQYAKQNPEAC